MGFLEDVNKRLTTPGAEAFSQERSAAAKPRYVREGLPPGQAQTADTTPPYLFDAAEAARRRRRKVVWSAVLLLIVGAIAGGTYGGIRWFRESRTVQKHHIQLAVNVPERVTSGEDVTVNVQLLNDALVAWENVALTLTAPDGFVLKQASPAPLGSVLQQEKPRENAPPTFTWDVGTLPSRAAVDFVVTGKLLGEEGTSALFTAKVQLTPKNRPNQPANKTAISTVVLAGIPVDLTIDVPQRASSGTPITIHLVYQNRTAKDLTGARVLLEAPAGFTVSSATPPVRERELSWELTGVPPQGQGEIAVSGIIEGDPDTAKPFVARVGFLAPDGRFLIQRTVQRTLTIARAALSLAQVMNNERDILKVNPGAEIQGKVQYKNTGSGGLREVIMKLTFEGVGLDPSSVRVQGGFFDSRRKQITWSAASSAVLRALRPGDQGELTFSFRMLPIEGLPFASDADRNFQLVSQAVGDSPDLPTPPGAPKQVATDRFEILLNSVPLLAMNGFYDDGRAGLPQSTGPLPPQVGQETILTVRARVSNTANDLVDGVYRTVLPENVRWVGKEYHTTGDVRFNERTRDVLWTVPLIAARAGTALPGPEFAYQVAIIPSLNQEGSEVALTRGHTLEATDAFTASRLRAEADAVTTRNVDPKKAEVVR